MALRELDTNTYSCLNDFIGKIGDEFLSSNKYTGNFFAHWSYSDQSSSLE